MGVTKTRGLHHLPKRYCFLFVRALVLIGSNTFNRRLAVPPAQWCRQKSIQPQSVPGYVVLAGSTTVQMMWNSAASHKIRYHFSRNKFTKECHCQLTRPGIGAQSEAEPSFTLNLVIRCLHLSFPAFADWKTMIYYKVICQFPCHDFRSWRIRFQSMVIVLGVGVGSGGFPRGS